MIPLADSTDEMWLHLSHLNPMFIRSHGGNGEDVYCMFLANKQNHHLQWELAN